MKKHPEKIAQKETKELLVVRLKMLDDGETSYNLKRLPRFKVDGNSCKICLVCKKMYMTDRGDNHYKEHTTCFEGEKEALRRFLNPRVKVTPVKKEATESKDVEELRKQVEKWEKKWNESDDALGVAMDEKEALEDEYRDTLQELFGADGMEYIKKCIASSKKNGTFKTYIELEEENYRLRSKIV